ncbi:9367_t:CDS:2 [Diversispora eburnea]|uniref:9367_t:CDS:1 n=1 Tax=Diversispora eburnea TaxID=1213867 RepID=A0A9N8YLA3_9GLOM|nr:9367_t:CDS:2 [Diversispora eburnea]
MNARTLLLFLVILLVASLQIVQGAPLQLAPRRTQSGQFAPRRTQSGQFAPRRTQSGQFAPQT